MPINVKTVNAIDTELDFNDRSSMLYFGATPGKLLWSAYPQQRKSLGPIKHRAYFTDLHNHFVRFVAFKNSTVFNAYMEWAKQQSNEKFKVSNSPFNQ